jgi:hypothetical protein
MSKQNDLKKREKKHKYSQTSWLENSEFAPAGVAENPEELQLHHNHEKSCL